MDKTVVVVFDWNRPHPIYKKAVRRQTRFFAHDPDNTCQLGDTVKIVESRPLSKTKRWRVAEILASKEIADVQPEEIQVDESVVSAAATSALGASDNGGDEPVSDEDDSDEETSEQ